MSELISNLNTIESCKLDIKSAIEAKGVSMSGVSFPDYATAIGSITTQFVTESLSVSQNGTYTPGQGVDGFSQVSVNVPQSVTGYTEKEITEARVQIVNLNNSASYVGSNAFRNNQTIETISLSNCGIVYNEAFRECSLLGEVYLPQCSHISNFAFNVCSQLSIVSIPECLSIGNYAFAGCSSLSDIDLPKCLNIGEYCFRSCRKLGQISLPECTFINNSTFENCFNLSQISLPKCVYTKNGGFLKCSQLQSVDLPLCSSIGAWTFNDCINLSVASFPVLQNQGTAKTLERCSSLTTLYLCTDTYTIPGYFLSTTNIGVLTSIYTNINNVSLFAVSDGWSSVSSLFIGIGDPDKPMLSYSNGLVYGYTKVLYSGFNTFLNTNKDSITSVELPNCIHIYDNGCSGYYSLNEVSLPQCDYIGYNAFGGCSILSKITLGYSGVCQLANSTAFNRTIIASGTGSIYVPSSLVTDYQNANNWSYFSTQIFPIPE